MNPAVASAAASADAGRCRVVIEGLSPLVDAGRFAVKRCRGDRVVVEADAYCDGHDRICCVLRWQRDGASAWQEAPMAALPNNRWRGEFVVDEAGGYHYTVTAWVDHFLTWRAELAQRDETADILVALRLGGELASQAAGRADGAERTTLQVLGQALCRETDAERGRQLALDPLLGELAARYPDRRQATTHEPAVPLWVDRPRARCGAWYEMFPRSCPATVEFAGHGTFVSCERRLPYVAAMGFDVLYLPPIHPIGSSQRKGPNNALTAAADDPGSPWAIGAASGGHCAVEPRLGSLDDFRHLAARARELGLEIALDIAFQCSPDHPWVREHPAWFRHRPDGSVQYAENPPKKYQDIYPLDFESADWRELWQELKSVFEFWIGEGIAIFRVDNPHTKAFPFWEWLIGELHRDHPEVLLLAEAFTQPKLMYRLAKLGFSQSYTYFTWRNSKDELTSYFEELTQSAVREFFRPNLWPNTPDILTEYLQFGGRPAFIVRLVLAATLGANYGIYGPAFELQEATPRDPGSEEYRNSEKYQVRHWDIDRPDSLREIIARVNRIRREHPALQQDWQLEFYEVDNEQILCYGKYTDDLADAIIVAVNLDPQHVQSGWLTLPLERFGIADPPHPYQVHDLLGDGRYQWSGARNFISLDPQHIPAHIFCLRRHVRTEHDFDYYL